jgi:hypothetical protein
MEGKENPRKETQAKANRASQAQIDWLVDLGVQPAIAQSLTRAQAHGLLTYKLSKRGIQTLPRARLDPDLLR